MKYRYFVFAISAFFFFPTVLMSCQRDLTAEEQRLLAQMKKGLRTNGLLGADAIVSREHDPIEQEQGLLAQIKRELGEMGNVYSHEPMADGKPFHEKNVMNRFWHSMKTQPQGVKNEALRRVIESCGTADVAYPLLRRNVAAAVMIGADPNISTSKCNNVVYKATAHGDYLLCEFLLGHNAEIRQDDLEHDPLRVCTNVRLAELLLRNGAKVKPDMKAGSDEKTKPARKFPILQCVASRDSYEAGLITLYRSHGASVFDLDIENGTALHSLAFAASRHSEKDIQEKFAALIAELSLEERKQLIEMRHRSCGAVFQILHDDLKDKHIFKVPARIIHFRDFLLTQLPIEA